jgi:hypothetical protein
MATGLVSASRPRLPSPYGNAGIHHLKDELTSQPPGAASTRQWVVKRLTFLLCSSSPPCGAFHLLILGDAEP